MKLTPYQTNPVSSHIRYHTAAHTHTYTNTHTHIRSCTHDHPAGYVTICNMLSSTLFIVYGFYGNKSCNYKVVKAPHHCEYNMEFKSGCKKRLQEFPKSVLASISWYLLAATFHT